MVIFSKMGATFGKSPSRSITREELLQEANLVRCVRRRAANSPTTNQNKRTFRSSLSDLTQEVYQFLENGLASESGATPRTDGRISNLSPTCTIAPFGGNYFEPKNTGRDRPAPRGSDPAGHWLQFA